MDESSVTIFGEISQLWHNVYALGETFEGLFRLWQIFYPSVVLLGTFY